MIRATDRIELGRRKHGNAVAALLWQRNCNEHIRRAILDEPQRTHCQSAWQIPVDVNIAEHEHHGESFARKANAERVPDGAVRAITSDDIAEARFLLLSVARKPHDDRIVALRQPGERYTSLDLDPVASEMGGEQALRLVLRQTQLCIGQVRQFETYINRRTAMNNGPHALDP
jgi:hypothetical protein